MHLLALQELSPQLGFFLCHCFVRLVVRMQTKGQSHRTALCEVAKFSVFRYRRFIIPDEDQCMLIIFMYEECAIED